MDKKIRLCISITLIWYVIVVISKIFVLQPDETVIVFRDTDHIIQGILYLILSLLGAYMSISLMTGPKNRESKVRDSLLYFFLMTTIGTLIQGTFNILTFTIRPLQTLFTDTVYIMIMSASFALGLFILEVFEEGIENPKNKKHVITLMLVFMIAVVILSKRLIFGGTDWETYIGIGVAMLTSLLLYGLLSKKAFYLRKRVDNLVDKKAFLFIALAGLFLIMGYLGVIAYNLEPIGILRYLNAILISIGYIFLYVGFIIPRRQKATK